MALRKHCDHCGFEIDSETAVITDVVQVEPVAKGWPGGNLVVRVTLDRCVDQHAEPLQWAPFDLCQQCLEYVASEVAIGFAARGERRRRGEEESET